MGGEGILGLFGHADRRALIGPKSLYYSHQEARLGNVHATGSTLLWVKDCRSLLRVVGIRSRILRQHSW